MALETGTFISDLVATNPLGSDLASTIDDHLRLIKSTIKNTFPNINAAVTATDEQLAPGGLGANPTGTIGLTVVNGSATTYLRSDGAPALSQAISPTWTNTHIFSGGSGGGTGLPLGINKASTPGFYLRETGAAADNEIWDFLASSEQLLFRILNDAQNTANNWLTVDRTAATVDRVHFPTTTSQSFKVGNSYAGGALNSSIAEVSGATGGLSVIATTGGTNPVISVWNQATVGDNGFVSFFTEGSVTTRGSITYNRAGGVTAYNTTSDERLKYNIQFSESAADVIGSIKIRSYNWKDTGNPVDHGLIAQELNKVAPYAVTASDDPEVMWQVDPSKLVPALIKYVQELEERIKRLESNR